MNPTEPVSLKTTPVADAPPRAFGGQAGSATFQRLLERLEALGRDPAAKLDGSEALPDALRRADDDFAQAMDLRRRLEDAFAQRR